jgi:hypothetical protein
MKPTEILFDETYLVKDSLGRRVVAKILKARGNPRRGYIGLDVLNQRSLIIPSPGRVICRVEKDSSGLFARANEPTDLERAYFERLMKGET